jgi:RNA-directed DNA polymerase
VQELNRFLRGWASYFRHGNSRRHFTKISTYALKRLALFVVKRHKRASGYGMTVVAYQSPNRVGLINLDGTVVTPSPFRDWRAKPNAGGERRR